MMRWDRRLTDDEVKLLVAYMAWKYGITIERTATTTTVHEGGTGV